MIVVLAAEEAAGRQTLQTLAAAGHVPRLVLTASPMVARLAGDLSCPVAPPDLVRDAGFATRLRDMRADLLLNVHSLHLIRPEVAAAPRIGGFNLHPGPLPEYAGLDAPSWAIVNGEGEHGVTLHWIDPGVDTGAIAYQARFAVEAGDTGLRLAMRCVERGVPLIRRLLEDAAAGRRHIPAVPQDLGRRRYYRRRAPNGGRLDWAQPALQVERLARAFDYTPLPSPWGRLTSTLDDRPIEIRKLTLTGQAATAPPGTLRRDGVAVLVAARDRWLRLRSIGVAGGAIDVSALPDGGRFAAVPGTQEPIPQGIA